MSYVVPVCKSIRQKYKKRVVYPAEINIVQRENDFPKCTSDLFVTVQTFSSVEKFFIKSHAHADVTYRYYILCGQTLSFYGRISP